MGGTVIPTSSSLIPGFRSDHLSSAATFPWSQPGSQGPSPAPPRIFVTSVSLCELQADFILSQVRGPLLLPIPEKRRCCQIGSKLLSWPETPCFSLETENPDRSHEALCLFLTFATWRCNRFVLSLPYIGETKNIIALVSEDIAKWKECLSQFSAQQWIF